MNLSKTGEKIFRDRYANCEFESVEGMWKRVSQAIAKAETESEFWIDRFSSLLWDFKFVPAGRILFGAGNDAQVTMLNCFVLPLPEDSRGGIIETLRQQVEIMSSGGGVGVNLSSLRYRGAEVKGVSGVASGAPSWGGLYAYATGLICQGGNRRGALGLVLEDWHPDIMEFIRLKNEENTPLSNANLSVVLSDRFMQAVKNDAYWELFFPLPGVDFNGTIFGNNPFKIVKSLKARLIFDEIVKQAHKNGEPGVWFIDTVNKFSNSVADYRLRCPNPCFEEPLPPFGACCLGSLNLPKFFSFKEKIDWDALSETIHLAVRFLDDVLDCTHLEPEQKDVVAAERRIGLSTIGLAELLLMLKLRYGSAASLTYIEQLFSFIANTAYSASAKLAAEKGSYPSYNFDNLLKSAFFTSLDGETKNIIRQNGLRNLTLLAQAPGGTISSLVSTSSGIEPYFDWVITINTRLGQIEEIARPYHDFRSRFPLEPLPDYFKTANEISWEEHVMVQSVIQKYTDASVSKTINLPESATLDDVANCIFRLHELGCKGGAIYRNKSRQLQAIEKKGERLEIPTRPNSFPPEESGQAVPWTGQAEIRMKSSGEFIIPLPNERHGLTVTRKTYFGNIHVTMNYDENGNPFEIFLEVGKAGSDIKAMTEAIGRLVSLCLRLDLPWDKRKLVELIVEQLKGIKSSPIGLGETKNLSIPDAVAQLMQTYFLERQLLIQSSPTGFDELEGREVFDLCPDCGSYSLSRKRNCLHCIYCGFSTC